VALCRARRFLVSFWGSSEPDRAASWREKGIVPANNTIAPAFGERTRSTVFVNESESCVRETWTFEVASERKVGAEAETKSGFNSDSLESDISVLATEWSCCGWWWYIHISVGVEDDCGGESHAAALL
jgi:hypothetical protein